MVKEYLVELAIDAGKNQFGNKVNEQKLKSILSNYIESQRSYNEICTLAEEIDFQGLVEYIKQDLLDSVNVRLFAPKKGDRHRPESELYLLQLLAQKRIRVRLNAVWQNAYMIVWI